MQPNAIIKTIPLKDGRSVSIETGRLAKQADGSVVVRMGDTMLLATVVASPEARLDVDFLPLSVDYQEKFAAGGKIPGGFLKREGRLSDREILTCRLVDRVIRPLFPKDYHSETQVNIQLISLDQEALPEALAALATSAALSVSDIPFRGPISEVRIVKVGDDFIVNPGKSHLENVELDMMVGASYDNIMMVEGELKEVAEDVMLEALRIAHEVIKDQCQAQLDLAKEVNALEKREYPLDPADEQLAEEIKAAVYDKVYDVAKAGIAAKDERKDAFKKIREEYIASLPEDSEVDQGLVKKYLHAIEKEASRKLVLKERTRLDGRQLDEIRPIWSEVDFLPSAHGSALFTRGETQSLTSLTLGTKLDEQMIDSALGKSFTKFMLHYNFPGFSTGEVKPNRGASRREIGHGNLALRALKGVIPAPEDNPYTIRIVSDVLESNGSSSMATVCAGSLALMDAGIHISAPVSGIAMGLISDSETGEYAVLSDILGDEDHLGDMDFKVTGTEKGITACQMDIKVEGLSYDILREALEQAKQGRLHILNEMKKTLAATREDLKPNAPRNVSIKIAKDLIGAVIGPGGKVVQEIQNETGATVVIEEIDDAGLVNIFAVNKEAMQDAEARIRGIIMMPEVGETYDGVVKSVMPYGAFIEFLPGKQGLLHISEIKWERVEKMEGILEVGEEIPVKLIEVDKRSGKFRLSRKALLPKPEEKAADA